MARELDVMYQGAFSYSIYIEESFAGLAAAVETLGLRERRALIVTDAHVAPLYLEEVRTALRPCFCELHELVLVRSIRIRIPSRRSMRRRSRRASTGTTCLSPSVVVSSVI